MARAFLYILLNLSMFMAFGTDGICQGPLPTASDELLNVTVVNRDGEPIKGLGAESFSIVEGQKTYPVTFIAPQNEPASIGILVDSSGSTKKKQFLLILSALNVFLDRAKVDNEYFVVRFSDSQELLAPPTQDKNMVKKAIETLALLEPKGNTRFYDSLNDALEMVSRSKFRKKALVIISDGQDNVSRLNFDELKKRMMRSGVPLYFVGVKDDEFGSMLAVQGRVFSDELMSISGGFATYVDKAEHLSEAFAKLAGQIENQYLITFKPSPGDSEKTNGGWRRIKVSVKVLIGSEVSGKPVVRAPRGYYSERPGS